MTTQMTASFQTTLAPPFTLETAILKVRQAEDGWNSRNPPQVAVAYSIDSRWRNRSEFIIGREQIIAFLTRKWVSELEYDLIKELWPFMKTKSPFAFLTRHAIYRVNGGGPTATRIGNSKKQGRGSTVTRASTIC